jgi:chromosome partitioning protein
MPMKLVVANQRGGVGKTVTSMVLGHSLSLKGKKTLLIDADSQGSLSMILRLRPKHYLADFIIRRFDLELCVEVVSPTLHVLCSNRQTADAERHIGNELARERVLEDLLARYDSAYDAIVIDAGPSIGQMQTCAMVYAQQVLIPCNMDLVSVSGAAACMQFCEVLSRAVRTPIRSAAILPTMVDRRIGLTRIARSLLAELEARYSVPLLNEIRTDASVGKATQARQFLSDFDPRCKAMQDYTTAFEQLMEILSNGASNTKASSAGTSA